MEPHHLLSARGRLAKLYEIFSKIIFASTSFAKLNFSELSGALAVKNYISPKVERGA